MTRLDGLKSRGSSLPFVLQIFLNSFTIWSYLPLTASQRGDSGMNKLLENTNTFLPYT